MEEFLARENIRRFEAQLESATDEGQRAQISALLKVERQHLREVRRTKVTPQT